ncbi:hypothetical protein T01_8179 [Trichinella spiralis]|uniref:Uncharacterized protein n=1 Tax=Trichinella spiralis TaxID=6334 RepID=A0A0V1BAL7_TRISP|nr:hypothetical protein T01_8179 [Trichinella spiralis]
MALHRCGPEISPVAWKKQTVALEEQIVTEFHTSYCKLAVLLVLVISDSPQIRPNKCRSRPPPRLLHFGTAVPYHLSTILAVGNIPKFHSLYSYYQRRHHFIRTQQLVSSTLESR